MANILPIRRSRVRIAQPADYSQRVTGKLIKQLGAYAAAADLPGSGRLEVAVQEKGGRRSERRNGRKAIDRRHVLEDEAHAISTAFAVPRAQCARQAVGVGPRVPRADETAPDLGGRAPERFRIQRVAAEEINLLQLREQSRTRVAA